MKQLLEHIKQLDYGVSGPKLNNTDILREQSSLKSCGFPPIPDEVVDFLQHHNGFLTEGRCIFGIDTKKHFLYDILAENVMANNPRHEDILILGQTSETYIIWLESKQNYLLIDKTTFVVLHKFKNFTEAVKYILKIND